MLIPPEPLSSPPVLVGFVCYVLQIFVCHATIYLFRFDLFLYLQTFLHSLIHSFESCIHEQDRQFGTIVWRSKICRGNLQHFKVCNDKLTSYIPTSCAFQQIVMFSILLKPCLYDADEYLYLYFKKLQHNSLKWQQFLCKNSTICYNIYRSNLSTPLSIFHVAQNQLKRKRKYIFPFCHNTLFMYND